MNNTRRAVLLDKTVAAAQGGCAHHFDALNETFITSKFERGCLLGNFSAELANQSAVIRESLAKLFYRWTKDLEIAIEDAQADGTVHPTGKPPTSRRSCSMPMKARCFAPACSAAARRSTDFMKLAFGMILT